MLILRHAIGTYINPSQRLIHFTGRMMPGTLDKNVFVFIYLNDMSIFKESVENLCLNISNSGDT